MAEERGKKVLREIVEAEIEAASVARWKIWELELEEADEGVRDFLVIAAEALTAKVVRLRRELREVA